MKVICVGRNYADHAKEMGAEKPSEPVIFLKPDTSVSKNNTPFYIPDFSDEVHFEAELVIRISKEGKNIQEKFAHKYYDEVGVGIDFTARDIQRKLKEKGLPWEISKGFNGSAAISTFVKLTDLGKEVQELNFSLLQNKEEKQNGNTTDMIFSVDELISYISRFYLLKHGDLIFTGTPAGVGKVSIGDQLEVKLEDKKMMYCAIK